MLQSRLKILQPLIVIFAFTLTVTWLAGGCSESSNVRPGTIARWERQLKQDYRAALADDLPSDDLRSRGLAQVNPSTCLKDRVDIPSIRAEVRRIESEQGGVPVRKSWAGLSLASFSPAQGRFLSERGDWLQALDFSKCDDVPCILNTLYSTPDGIQGWLAYGWYLRTGYTLSCRDKIPPNIYFPGKSYEDHLFTPEELRAFWLLSHALPPSMRSMASLQTLHRLPKNGVLSSWGDGSTCGDAVGSYRSGYIRLADGCLSLPARAKGMDGFFYTAVTHEIAHRQDSFLGGINSSLSDSDEWKAFSGWRKEIVVDTNRAGVRSYQWVSDPVKEGFVRDYAGTSPAEDWADTVAFTRFESRQAQVLSPRKSDYISKKVFGGRTFDNAGLIKFYGETATASVGAQIASLVNKCMIASSVIEGDSAAAILAAHRLKFSVPLPESLAACLERGLDEQVNTAFNRIRETEYEACGLLASLERDLRESIFAQLNPEISKLVSMQESLAPLFQASVKLQSALALQIDPREAYLRCYRGAEAEACFRTALVDAFDHAAEPYLPSLIPIIERMREDYLIRNSFEKVAVRVVEFHRQVFAGVEAQLEQAASSRWSACLALRIGSKAVVEETAPITEPFTGGERFVSAAILNCVNSAVSSDVNGVRDRFLARLGLSVTDVNVKAFTYELLLPRYLETVQSRLETSAAAELRELELRRDVVVDAVAGELIANLVWVGESTSLAAAATACGLEGRRIFDGFVAKLGPDEALPTHFAAIEDLRRDWAGRACKRAVNSAAVLRMLTATVDRAARDWNDAVGELSDHVWSRALEFSKTCASLHLGRRSSGLVKKRRDCLLGYWNAIEVAALDDWVKTASALKVAYRNADVLQYLENRRKEHQAAALKKLDRM